MMVTRVGLVGSLLGEILLVEGAVMVVVVVGLLLG